MIKYVAFDLDDTLYRHSDFEFQAYEFIAEMVSQDWQVCKSKYLENMKTGFLRGVKTNFFNDTISPFLPHLDESWENYVRTAILPAYRNFKPFHNISLLPDVLAVLNELKEDGYILLLITNGRVEIQNAKIDALHIRELFKKIYISDQFYPSLRKPNTTIFETVMSDVECTPEEIIYIGDNYEIDGSCQQCGIKFVHVSNLENLKKVLK